MKSLKVMEVNCRLCNNSANYRRFSNRHGVYNCKKCKKDVRYEFLVSLKTGIISSETFEYCDSNNQKVCLRVSYLKKEVWVRFIDSDYYSNKAMKLNFYKKSLENIDSLIKLKGYITANTLLM